MGKFDGWLICSDFDGTLYVDKSISEENRLAISRFQEGGGLFTFASGRFACMFDELCPGIRPNAPLVTLNGSVISDCVTGKTLYRGTVGKAPSVDFTFGLYDNVPGVTGITFHEDNTSWCFSRRRERENGLCRQDFIAALPEEITKMIIHVTTEASDDVVAYLRATAADRYNISRSWINGIELNGIADSKGRAVTRIKAMTGARHLVCVGDYENDIDMIKAADIGYAVGDALPALIAAADKVTVPAREHALAAIVHDIETGADA